MAQLLSTNVAGTLNVSTGSFSANNSPLSNIQTQVYTGISAFMKSNTSRTSTTALSAEANLALTVNETGIYVLGGLLYICRNTGSGNGGIKMDFAGGTALINLISWSALGSVNGASNIANAVHANTALMSFTVISNTATANDWLSLTGIIQINSAGTIIPRYAQVVSNARSSNICANSYLTLTKIGSP